MTDAVRTITVPLGDRRYPIYVSAGRWDATGRRLRELAREDRVFVVATGRVRKLFGSLLERALGRKLKIEWLKIPDGEIYKTWETCGGLLEKLARRIATRESLLVSLGGGVAGDVAGFAAAVYMRGIAFAQIPTTLTAQVDAAVGGKTGVDLKSGKNLAGAFHQPKAVFIHTHCLTTLPRREYVAGLAEVIKYGVIKDTGLFARLRRHRDRVLSRDPAELSRIVSLCAAIKAEIVGKDERERGLRRILNYGHTLGHAVETLSSYRIRHGEAVAEGMVFAARLGESLGVTPAGTERELAELAAGYGLPVRWPNYSAEAYLEAIARDKKARVGGPKFILPVKIGRVIVRDVAPAEVARCL